MISIFDYFTYHDFLRDWFTARQNVEPNFSQRAFLRSVGISSPAVLQRTLQGALLPKKYIAIFSKALGLKENESEYWIKLVAYGNAKKVSDRQRIFVDLLSKRSVFSQYKIDDNLLKFYKLWYYPVVLEVVKILDGVEDYNKISRMVIPPITTIQVESAIQFLLENQFLIKTKDGLQPGYPPCTEVASKQSALIAAFHLKNLEVNRSVAEEYNEEKVDMESLTLSLGEASYSLLRKELLAFKERILELAKQESEADQVFHMNLSVLPRSRQV